MLTYFSKYLSNRAIVAYIITLTIVGMLFWGYGLPFQFVVFGLVSVVVFFIFSTRLSVVWQRWSSEVFAKKIFFTALLIRLVYVVFIYFYYIWMTGEAHAFGAADELFYTYIGTLWHDYGFSNFAEEYPKYADFSDRGYGWWLAFENLLFGTGVLIPRLIKCLIDAFTCVLVYNLAKRNFEDTTARMAAIFCMLMPNFWYYCGVTLKETEMVFLTVLFVERTDYMLRQPKFRVKDWILPVLIAFVMFTFRTSLAAVLVIALLCSFIFASGRRLPTWKRIAYTLFFVIIMLLVVRVEIVQEVQEIWEGRGDQAKDMEWRAEREGGNAFAKYAGAAVFAPLIFTIPLPTMVDLPMQENQMMLNGANYIKSLMSGFTIFALFLLLYRKEWRKHILPLAVMGGYLLVLVFSNFAQSERFHFPALPFELMFAAYGISQLKAKHRIWFNIWIILICVIIVGWNWFKLAGRGMV